jgi:hypothetical protein
MKTINSIEWAKDFDKEVIIVHGMEDATVPVESSGLYKIYMENM